MEPRIGVNVSRADADSIRLPDDARNVTYRIGGAFDPVPRAYEFDTSETAFRAWAAERGAAPREGPATVRRYDGSSRRIDRGLYFGQRTGSDSGWEVAYDRDAGRAYYHSSSR